MATTLLRDTPQYLTTDSLPDNSTPELLSANENFTKIVTKNIRELAFVFQLPKELSIEIQNLCVKFLDSDSIKNAYKETNLRELFEEVFIKKIAYSIGAISSFSNIHKELTGENLNSRTALALMIVIITQINLSDSLAEMDRSYSYQKNLFKFLSIGLLRNQELIPEIDSHSMRPETHNNILLSIDSILLGKFRYELNKLIFEQEKNEVDIFSRFLLGQITTYSLSIAYTHSFSHIDEDEKKIMLADLEANYYKLKNSGQISTDENLDKQAQEFFRTGDKNSPFLDSNTNGISFLITVYLLFEKETLFSPNEQNLENLINNIISITSKTGNLFVSLDNVADTTEDEKHGHDRNPFVGKTQEEIYKSLLHSYTDAITPFVLLGNKNNTYLALKNLINDYVILMSFKFKVSIIKDVVNYFEFTSISKFKALEMLLKELGLTRNISRLMRRFLFSKILTSFN